MNDIAIRVENLGKRYRIGAREKRANTLRERLGNLAASPFDYLRSTLRGPSEEEIIWALKDVSFEVKQGEVLGIIGRNGAGKTTLLKILSRITEPTEGYAEIHGRVGSLLEVGTGFHPELTGRENIYLNGAILGMKRAEIDRKFDEMVAFAEIEKFMDTPVKHYSSGMYVRLAFAVAAHLEPEILLVDEVLAVGDVAFQKKCLGKMRDVAREGRTVLFVSHNMAAIEVLCSSAMLIENGKNHPIASSKQVIETYLQGVRNLASLSIRDRKDRRGKGKIRFVDVEFFGKNDADAYAIGDDICVRAKVISDYAFDVRARLIMNIYTANELGLIACDSKVQGKTYTIPGASETTIVCKIHSPLLNYGNYHVNLVIFVGNEPEDWITSAAKFSITSGTFEGRVTTNPFPVLSGFEWMIEESV